MTGFSGGRRGVQRDVFSITLSLWPRDRMPGRGADRTEHETPSRGDNVVRLTDVSEPSMAVFKAPGATAATPAVIVCPGGGYGILAYNKEGTEIAAWLNTIGITGIVLKYRVPDNREGAFQDLQRAMRLARHHATAWNIATDRLGVLGFSAGGHLCARLSTGTEQATYSCLDAVDDQTLLPHFAILVYPAYLSDEAGRLDVELAVRASTPPTFLVHTEDDQAYLAGSRAYQAALKAARIPHEFLLCATGGHGYGLRSDKQVRVWPVRCRKWLTGSGILQPATAARDQRNWMV